MHKNYLLLNAISPFILDLEVEVLKKIANLRTYYPNGLQKEKETRKSWAGADDICNSKWPHYRSLTFLRDLKSNF